MPMARVSAITFDFNGTISNDEPILCAIFQGLFRRRGRPLSEREYYDELAGLSDEAIVTTWLGEDYPDVTAAVAERAALPRARRRRLDDRRGDAARLSVTPRRGPDRDRVGGGARRDPPGGASRRARFGLRGDRLGRRRDARKAAPRELSQSARAARRRRGEAVAFEDTESGIASATGAGMRCIAVRGTLAPARLAKADELIEAIDVDVVRRLLEG